MVNKLKKSIVTTILLFIILSITFGITAANISILFIGNSFTRMNNFSQMVSDIAEEMGDTIFTDFAAYDSWDLEKHLITQATIDKINSYDWNYVVLQEQSQRPAMDMITFTEKTLLSASKLLDIIYDNNIETCPLLFMTWGRKGGDSELCRRFPYMCTYEGMQDTLIARYYLLGDILGISVVPCGVAWRYFTLNGSNFSSNINLFYKDDKHSNEVGSYLNALCFYSAVTGRTAEYIRCPIKGISDKEVLILQKVAFETIITKDK